MGWRIRLVSVETHYANGSPKQMCEHAAATYVAAGELAQESLTFAARHYFLGVRDAMEMVFRCQANIGDTSADAWGIACEVLDDMPESEVCVMLNDIKSLMRQGRAEATEVEIRSVS